MVRLAVLGPALVLVLSRAWVASATCYDSAGGVFSNLVPCNTTTDISVCCSSADFCTSNGLCLDAGGDNDFTLQGCTDPTWSAPCSLHTCGLLPTQYWYLEACSLDNGIVSYCCWHGADRCCSNSTISRFSIHVATSFYHPQGASTTSSATTTTSTGSASITNGLMTTVTVTTSTESPTALQANANNTAQAAQGLSSQDIKTVAIAVPVAVCALAAATFLAWMCLKRRPPKDAQTVGRRQVPNGLGLVGQHEVEYGKSPNPSPYSSVHNELPPQGVMPELAHPSPGMHEMPVHEWERRARGKRW